MKARGNMKKLSTNEISKFILDKLSNVKFKIIDINYHSSYFIFDRYPNSNIHFKIKGVPRWKFGLWIDEGAKDEDKMVSIFAQHESNIDKFKPSRSALCEEYTKDEFENILENDLDLFSVKEMINFIKKHPFIAYYGENYSGSYFWNYIENETYVLLRKIKNKLDKAYEDLYEQKLTELKIKIAKKNKHISELKMIKTFEFNDRRKYDIICKFNEKATEKQEARFLDFWFKKDKYKTMDLRICKDGFDGYYFYEMKKGE